MLTPEMIEEARALRVKNRKLWTFLKLAQHFNCTRQEVDYAMRISPQGTHMHTIWRMMTTEAKCSFIEESVAAGRTQTDMATRAGCSIDTIRTFAGNFGIPLRQRQLARPQRQWSTAGTHSTRQWILEPGQTNPWAGA
jgi:hypothetical protein